MAELYDNAKRILTDEDAVGALSGERHGSGHSFTLSAIDYGLPVVIDALRSRTEDSAGIVDLLNRLRTMETSELGTPAMWMPGSARAIHGPVYARLLLQPNHRGSGIEAVVNKLADRARVEVAVAERVLAAAAWTVCGVLKQTYGSTIDRHTMLAVLQRERADLASEGWDPWLRAVQNERMAITAGGADRVPTSERPLMASDQGAGRYPPPVSRPARQSRPANRPSPTFPPADQSGAHPSVSRGTGRHGSDRFSGGYVDADSRRAAGGGRESVPPPVDRRRPADQRPAPARHRPLAQDHTVARHTRPRAAAAAPPRRWWPVVLGVAALLVLAGLVFWLLTRDDGTTSTSLDEIDEAVGDTDEAADEAEGEGTQGTDVAQGAQAGDAAIGADSAESVDSADSTDPVDSAAPPISESTVVSMEVPMTDVFGGTDAEGVMNLDFFPFTGEICFEIQTTGLATPFDGHIHAGDSAERGGIVVDFDALNDSSNGCLTSSPNDVQAILAEPAAYYTEMHDPTTGGPAIRAQLSEAVNVVDAEGVLGRPLSGSDGPSDIDPDGGGALIEIEGNTIILKGAVADDAAAQRVRDSLAGIDLGGIAVEDQLVTEDGAPLPSGRIVVSDAIFFEVGSADLSQSDTQVLDLLARIFQARPAWSMTIVGHTDSTGNDVINLELSLARADSVRTALVDRGVDAMSLKIRGAGATEARADNATPEGRSQNRRIEFEIEAR